jgi:hypothetical protein
MDALLEGIDWTAPLNDDDDDDDGGLAAAAAAAAWPADSCPVCAQPFTSMADNENVRGRPALRGRHAQLTKLAKAWTCVHASVGGATRPEWRMSTTAWMGRGEGRRAGRGNGCGSWT